MPTFAYTARETATGRELRNHIEAVNEQAAIAALLNRSLLVIDIKEKISKRGQTRGGKVAAADLVVFTRQLATMIDAGITIVQSMQALAQQNHARHDPRPLQPRGKRRKFVRGAVSASKIVQPALRRHGRRGRKGRLAR